MADEEKLQRRREIQKKADDKRKELKKQQYQESIQDKLPKEYPRLASMFKHKTVEQMKENIYFSRDKNPSDSMYGEDPNKGSQIYFCVPKNKPDQIEKMLSSDQQIYEVLREDVLLHPFLILKSLLKILVYTNQPVDSIYLLTL